MLPAKSTSVVICSPGNIQCSQGHVHSNHAEPVLTNNAFQISHMKNQKLLSRGKPEVDAILAELRALAQLDHPNIVRYYSGWIDWFHVDDSVQTSEEPDAILVANDERSNVSFGRIATGSDDHVLFENSTSQGSSKSTATDQSGPSAADKGLIRTNSQGTRATVSDEDVESISRSDKSSESVSSLHLLCSNGRR